MFINRYSVVVVLSVLLLLGGCSTHSRPEKGVVPDEVATQMLQAQVNVAVVQQEAAQEMARRPVMAVVDSSETPQNPILRPGMKVSLQTVEDDEINGTFEVPFTGPMVLPYEVKVDSAGHTLSAFRGLVKRAYRPFFKIVPTMNIGLAGREQMVEVQGLVQKPGKVLVASSASLDEVLSKAGGLTPLSEGEGKAQYIKVLPASGAAFHLSLSEYYAGAASFDLRWKGGDRIFFQREQPLDAVPGSLERPKIQFLGQVTKPGAYPYMNGENFFHYLVLAGGPTERTDFEKVEVIRLRAGKRETKRYDLTKRDVVPPVEAGDIVIVHALKNNQTISNATSVLNTLATALLAAVAL